MDRFRWRKNLGELDGQDLTRSQQPLSRTSGVQRAQSDIPKHWAVWLNSPDVVLSWGVGVTDRYGGTPKYTHKSVPRFDFEIIARLVTEKKSARRREAVCVPPLDSNVVKLLVEVGKKETRGSGGCGTMQAVGNAFWGGGVLEVGGSGGSRGRERWDASADDRRCGCQKWFGVCGVLEVGAKRQEPRGGAAGSRRRGEALRVPKVAGSGGDGTMQAVGHAFCGERGAGGLREAAAGEGCQRGGKTTGLGDGPARIDRRPSASNRTEEYRTRREQRRIALGAAEPEDRLIKERIEKDNGDRTQERTSSSASIDYNPPSMRTDAI
ncbi:hypothetical protein B0H16DRAFT_1455117 [Mycena metata]|uniref:Uncharacterized protein n=1 Tax=Mycena metata TaxID=1033252 RepID=A0AAD7JI40_9AGAR|nr:hypothetical protein B0H16DRAFT_1455117 [Mycena metata]